MPTTHNLGDYDLRETDTGEFEIVKPDGTVILRHDDLNDILNLIEQVGINDLSDATSGATVYDSSTEELTADVNNQKVSTGNTTTKPVELVYMSGGRAQFEGYDSPNTAMSNVPTNGGVIRIHDDVTITEPLVHPGDRYVGLEGDGFRGSGTLIADSANWTGGPLLDYTGGAGASEWWGHIANIKLQGNATASELLDLDMAAGRVREVFFDNASGNNVTVRSGQNTFVNKFYGCVFNEAGNHNVDVAGLGNQFINCRNRGAASDGYVIRGGAEAAARVFGGVSEAAGGASFRITNNSPNRNAIISGVHMEGSTTGVEISPVDNGSRIYGPIVQNCRFTSTLTDAITAATDYIGVTVTGNTFSSDVTFTGGVGGSFIGLNSWEAGSLTDSAAGRLTIFEPYLARFKLAGFGSGTAPTNLSGTTGSHDGETRPDDGTNTSNRGVLCVWDDNASVWVPQDGSAEFA